MVAVCCVVHFRVEMFPNQKSNRTNHLKNKIISLFFRLYLSINWAPQNPRFLAESNRLNLLSRERWFVLLFLLLLGQQHEIYIVCNCFLWFLTKKRWLLQFEITYQSFVYRNGGKFCSLVKYLLDRNCRKYCNMKR